MTCPLCGKEPDGCQCSPRELMAWAMRQLTLAGLSRPAAETVRAWLAARGGRLGRRIDPRQRVLL